MSEALSQTDKATYVSIINSAQTANAVQETTANGVVQWSFAAPPAPLVAQGANILAGGAAVQSPSDPIQDPGNQAAVQNAINLSNAAAATTPQAAVPEAAPVVGSPAPDKNSIQQSIVGFVTGDIGKIGDDIAALHGNESGAKLHWWGWEAKVNETGTKALVDLLQSREPQLAAMLGLFAASVPVLAAIAGFLTLVAEAIAADITATDTGNGVLLRGYLWIGVSVHAL